MLIAALTVIATLRSTASTSGGQLLGLLAFILVCGVPHGALDPVVADRLYHLRSTAAWAGFVVAYVALAAAMISVWRVWPNGFVVGFVVLSAYHFSGDPDGDVPRLFRVVYGGLIIILPALAFAPEVARLLATLLPATSAIAAATAMHWLAGPWLVAALVLVVCCGRRFPAASRELSLVALLAVFAPPMWSFTIFFCVMHSARHVLRLHGSWEPMAWRSLVRTAALPVLATGVALVVGWRLLPDSSPTTRAVQLVFVALAALTVPHMLLVEQLRLGTVARLARWTEDRAIRRGYVRDRRPRHAATTAPGPSGSAR